MFLDQILATKREEVEKLKRIFRDKDFDQAAQLPGGRNFVKKFSDPSFFAIIAEIKPASPSKGLIRPDVNPNTWARRYQKGGAAAISVLTDVSYFQGKAENLIQARQVVSLPVLRKDFIIHPLQVLESKNMGADLILLIAAALSPEELRNLTKLAHELKMEVLVEVHDEKEVETALKCEADVVGINNRNLFTFQTDLQTTERLRPFIPQEIPVISESGIHSPLDAKRMYEAGAQGILIGEYLMRKEQPESAIEEILQGVIG